MNFNDYKAKHAKFATSTATAVETTATKIDNAVKKGALKTKDAASTTGSALVGTLPVTTRKHNAFAAKVSADLNGLNRRVDRHDLLFDVIAEGTGLVLPSNEVLDQYLDEQAAPAAQAPAQEEVIAGVVAKVLASLGLSAAPVVESVLSPEVTAELDKQYAAAPTSEEEEGDAERKKEQRRLAAIAKKAKEVAKKEVVAEEVVEEEVVAEEEAPVEEEAPKEEVAVDKEKPAKSIKRKRKKGGMGRQEPLAAE